jgi:cytochrome b6-f complex iron-sulfur subunit
MTESRDGQDPTSDPGPTSGAPPVGESPPPHPRRRDILSLGIVGTAGALGVVATYPALALMAPARRDSARTVVDDQVTKMPTGSGTTVMLGERPVIVLRLADGSFRAFLALCPHLDCVVQYSRERQRIECPCHDGVFDLEGKNVSGPPPRPLKQLEVAVRDGRVEVTDE